VAAGIVLGGVLQQDLTVVAINRGEREGGLLILPEADPETLLPYSSVHH
jgi:hypothetical protein